MSIVGNVVNHKYRGNDKTEHPTRVKAGLGSGSEHEHLHTEMQRCPQHPGHNGKLLHLKAHPLQMLASSPLTSLMIPASVQLPLGFIPRGGGTEPELSILFF